MAAIYLPHIPEHAHTVFGSEPGAQTEFQRINAMPDARLHPYRPYLISCSPGDEDVLFGLRRFSTPDLTRLTYMSVLFDGYTLAVAQVTDELIQPVLALIERHGLAGASALMGAANSKYSEFQRSILRYQEALVDLHQTSQAKAQVRGTQSRAAFNPQLKAKEVHARQMHAEMTQRFQVQLERYQASLGAQARRSALLNVDRGVQVARHGRSMQSNTATGRRTGQTLQFANSRQVNTVHRIVQGSQVAGRGLLVVDFGVRTNQVHNAYRNGGNATRVALTQYSGLVAGTGAGFVAGKATAAAIGMTLSLTPVGWVLLLGAAVVVGFAASSYFDHQGQTLAGVIYDSATGRR